ncbi:hypothetical protein FRC03_008700 [Tulasnella sp. 419]|nr:hypothetical protein FRC03_008700 [Tulasnella sp. 419]
MVFSFGWSSSSKAKAKGSTNTAFAALVTTLTIAKESLDGVPIPGLKASVGGVLEVLKTVDKMQGNARDIEELQEHVEHLNTDIIERLTNAKLTADLEARMDRLEADLDSIANEYDKISNKRNFFQFLSVHDHANTIAGLNRRLDRAIQAFTTGLVVEIEQRVIEISLGTKKTQDIVTHTKEQTSAIHNATKRIEKQAGSTHQVVLKNEVKTEQIYLTATDTNARLSEIQLNQVELELLSRLPNADARYDSAARSSAPSCLEDTRVALLEDIFRWIDGHDAEKVYWLHGLAGTGKSTIAHTVAERLAKKGQLGATFFFSRVDTGDRRDPLRVLPAIAHQLAEFSPKFKLSLVRSLETRKDAGTANLMVQMEKLLAQPLRDMGVQSPGESSTVVVVLDALDECDNQLLVTSLLKLVSEFLLDLPHMPFKLFITSRPEHHIAMNFTESCMSRLARPLVLHDIDTAIVQSDIQVYLRHELARVAQEFQLSVRPNPWPSPSDLAELVRRAGALFLVASTGIKFIGDKRIRQPKQQLRLLLSDVQASGQSPYKDLDQVYHQIVRASVEGDDIGIVDFLSKRFRDVVGAIINLGQPLPPMTLHHLLMHDIEYITAAVDLLRSVIITPSDPESNSEPYRVFHSSFPSYLTDRCEDARFAIHPVLHHTQLALHCLHLLNSFLRRNPCELPNPLVLNSEVPDLNERVKRTILPHHQYVCQYWGFHLQAAFQATKSLPKHHAQSSQEIDDIRNDLLETFSSFCREKLLHWVEAMSLLGLLGHTIPILKSAETWLKSLDPSHPMLPLLNDGQRLLLQYFDPIQLSASQIYCTALAFMPQSALFTAYESSLDHSVKLITNRESSWNPCMRTLTEHANRVTSVALSSDSTHIVSGSWDKSVCIWDAATGSLVKKLEGHDDFVTSVAWSHDSSLVVSGSWDKSVHIWDMATGNLVKRLKGHSNYVSSVAFSRDGSLVASGSHDHTVGIWDVATGALVRQLQGHISNVTSVAMFPNKSFAVSGSDDKTVGVWDLRTGSLIKTMKVHEDSVQSVAVSHNEKYIASGSRDSSICLWDALNGSLVRRLTGDANIVCSVAFSYDDAYIVSGSQDKAIRVWDVSKGEMLKKLEGHTDEISSVVFSFDGSQIVSGSYDRAINIWDATTEPVRSYYSGHSDSVQCIAISSDKTRIATGSRDRTVCLWNAQTGSLVKKQGGHVDSVYSVAFAHDDALVASGSQDKTVHIWQTDTGSTVSILKGHLDSVPCVAFSHDGKHIASGSQDKTVRLWDIKEGTLVQTLEGHQHAITSVAFSLDGSYVLASDILGKYLSWDTATFTRVQRKASLLLDSGTAEQSIAIEGQWAVSMSGAQGELRRLCYLPVPSSSISAHLTRGHYLVIGTKSGVLYILNFSQTLQPSN